MKISTRILSLFAAAVLAAATAPAAAAAQNADDAAPVLRGARIGTARAVPLATVLADPQAHTRTPVLVEGTIVRACTDKGCWMQLAPAADEEGVRVTFKGYDYFIPLNAAGMKARAEGVVVVKRHSRKDADHLAAEGARLRRNRDGTAMEITFVASGVELRQ